MTLTLTELIIGSSPIIVMLLALAWKGIPTLIAWRRERKYQAEWYRSIGRTHVWR